MKRMGVMRPFNYDYEERAREERNNFYRIPSMGISFISAFVT